MKRSEARVAAERDFERLTNEIRWDIQKVLGAKLDSLQKEGEGKELLFIRASKVALKRELLIARFGSFFDSGYRAYLDHLSSQLER